MSIPPIPTRDEKDGFDIVVLVEVVPALARITVELPREHQRLVNFQSFCPARVTLERVVGWEIDRVKTRDERRQFVWLSRLAAYALEVADEVHQFDGKSSLDFAAGFVRAETSTHDLFAGPEAEERALADAIERSPLRASQATPFALGFQTRRDQRRAAAADGKESV
jgi:hypothetical protein